MGQTRSRKIEKRWKIKVDHEVKKRSRFFSGRETQTSALRSWKPNTTVQNYNQAGKYLCLLSQQEIYNGSLECQGRLRLRNCVCCLCPSVYKELSCSSSRLPPGSCTCRQGSGCPEPPGQADPAPWLSATHHIHWSKASLVTFLWPCSRAPTHQASQVFQEAASWLFSPSLCCCTGYPSQHRNLPLLSLHIPRLLHVNFIQSL